MAKTIHIENKKSGFNNDNLISRGGEFHPNISNNNHNNHGNQ